MDVELMTIILMCLVIAIPFILTIRLLYRSFTPKYFNLPPTLPNSLPILGHLRLLKEPVHRTLQCMSEKHGPIISLWFASRRVVLVSSSSLVEECFTKNDIVLANRVESLVSKYIGYDSTDVTDAQYGDHWRNLRRICAIEIFSNQRLNSFISIRMDEVERLLYRIRGGDADFKEVELKPMLLEMTLNNIMRMIAGKRYYGDNVENLEEARQFREIITQVNQENGVSYPGDYSPLLKWLDFGRYEKRVKSLGERTDVFMQGLLDESRRRRSRKQHVPDTMIDHLLSLQESEPEYYTDQIIKGLIVVMILAGTDTSSVTLEWAMTELVNHPQVLDKVRAELDSQLGKEQLIDELDVPKLNHLQAIISETLRLYPPAPLLVPHVSSDYCTLGGYDLPCGTIVVVNAWAIHRDPGLWDDPTSFNPMRFHMQQERGGAVTACKLIPFGMGRRACPGEGLARRVVGLALGSLIQCFEWKRVSEELVDTAEGIGVTMPKAQPLKAMCKARPIMNKLFPRHV